MSKIVSKPWVGYHCSCENCEVVFELTDDDPITIKNYQVSEFRIDPDYKFKCPYCRQDNFVSMKVVLDWVKANKK